MGTTYPQMGSTFTGMGSMGSSSMNAMPRQMQQLSMATDYNVNLVSNMMVRTHPNLVSNMMVRKLKTPYHNSV